MKKYVVFLLIICMAIVTAIIGGCKVNEEPEAKYYSVEYLASDGGTVSGEANQTVENGGNATEVVAVANTGYKFVEWSDGIETAERTDRNVTADISVTAKFERLNYTVRYITGDCGYIRGLENQMLRYGDDASGVTAIPNKGYKFVKWSDGIETAERTDRNITANKTVTAIFEKFTYNMKYETDGNGYIVGKASQSVGYGENAAKVTAIPNNGYKFVKWSDGVESDVRQDLNVKENVAVTAEFEFLFESGNGERTNPFIIENYQQLLSMRAYPDQFYRLANDLDLAGINHEPIFDDNKPFSGYFDGNGKTIDNLTVATVNNYPSLFGFIFDGIVSNLNLSNVDITTIDFNTNEAGTNYYVGTVAGYSVGLLNNISVEGEITVDGLTYDGAVVGGLVGSANRSYITFCDVDVRITARNIIREHSTGSVRPFMLGGIAGVCESVDIMDSVVRGEINISNCCDNILVGGLVDWYTVKYNEYEITRCQTNVAITSDNINHKLAGFIEFLDIQSDYSFEIVDCSVIGNITGGWVGGFIHNCYAFGDLLIENCFVKNEIKECTQAAGFVYEINGYKGTIRYSYANSKMKTYNQSGIACGFAYSLRNINLINCNSSGSVSAACCCGFSWYLSHCHIERCYSDSDIEAVYNCPAFSYTLINSEIINCYSQNEFINEPQQNNENIPLAMILVVRESIIRNFYYSGNAIEKVFKSVSDSEITNFHCLKNENLTGELIGGNTSSTIDITVYENKEEMYGITDKLNDGLSEVVWRNVPKNFPKLNVI